MLKALLIDDEERATDALRLMIEKTVPEITQVKVCNDSRKAAEMIHEFQPGLVFLDIQMPHLNGFQLLEKMPNKNFKLIFTTAYNEYAIQAIRFSAFDYLLKPIDVEELQGSVQRFLQTNQDYTHKSHLVNKKFISFIDHDGFAILKDKSKVEVSRRRKEEVMEALK